MAGIILSRKYRCLEYVDWYSLFKIGIRLLLQEYQVIDLSFLQRLRPTTAMFITSRKSTNYWLNYQSRD